MIIKTDKFILRPYKKGDEKSLRKNINNRNVSMFMSSVPYPYTLKDAKNWISVNINERKKKKPEKVNFAIVTGGEIVGSVGFSNIKYQHKAEIGYWLAEKYWRQGIMTQAVKLLTKFGFEKLKLRRIFATVFSPNQASKRVLEKAGFTLEGIMKKHHKKENKFYDSYLLAKVKQ